MNITALLIALAYMRSNNKKAFAWTLAGIFGSVFTLGELVECIMGLDSFGLLLGFLVFTIFCFGMASQRKAEVQNQINEEEKNYRAELLNRVKELEK